MTVAAIGHNVAWLRDITSCMGQRHYTTAFHNCLLVTLEADGFGPHITMTISASEHNVAWFRDTTSCLGQRHYNTAFQHCLLVALDAEGFWSPYHNDNFCK